MIDYSRDWTMLMNMQIIITIELMVLYIIGSSEALQNGKLHKKEYNYIDNRVGNFFYRIYNICK